MRGAWYVDDMGQLSSDVSVLRERRAIVAAAVDLAQVSIRLRLSISEKTVVISSSRLTAMVVQKRLSALGVKVQVCTEAADLGIQNSSRSRRVVTVLKKRLFGARLRLFKIRGLVKSTRAARRLVRASPCASALWGMEGTGLSPSMLHSLRTQVASASGIGSPSRCATTAIAFAFGKDPAIEVFERFLKAFVRLCFHGSLDVAVLRVARRFAFAKVSKENPVIGP